DPRNPSTAVLAHEAVWPAAVVSLLMFLGGCVAFRMGFPRGSRMTRRIEAVSGPFLMMLGLFGYIGFFGLPLSRGLKSLAGREPPCIVESAQVRSATRQAITVSFKVFWPDIIYHYEVDGTSYRANTYSASDLGSTWYYGAKGVVRRNSHGMKTICYVNPSDP